MTVSQLLRHFFRQAKGRPQTGQVFSGRNGFLCISLARSFAEQPHQKEQQTEDDQGALHNPLPVVRQLIEAPSLRRRLPALLPCARPETILQ
jgi:hypothetical protein